MSAATGPRGLVFRADLEIRDGASLAAALARDLEAAEGPGADEEARLIAPLLSAAALEGALDDAGSPAAPRMRAVTDRIARAYQRRDPAGLLALAARLPAGDLPQAMPVHRPEGFAYYALVPRDLADAACRLIGLGSPVTVVGLRTIGVALSAAVRAALVAAGRPTHRFTVRPQGDPYDRRTTLSPEQAGVVQRTAALGGGFIVVDEGPGYSGSSLLSAAEALVAHGAHPRRVALLGTRAVDPTALVTPDASARWGRFRSVSVAPGKHWPAEADPRPQGDLSGGAWRARLWPDRARWPASWVTFERLKRLSRDGQWLFKFEGLASHGAAVHERAETLARAGLAPQPAGPPDGRGFVAYPVLSGRPLGRKDGRIDAVRAALARSCAARSTLFPAAPDLEGLSAMARTNVAIACGVSLPGDWRLGCERPAIVDGRMPPHEWWLTDTGIITKCDGAAHGDDHLYPGPADVAWDLAGALIEWDLDARGRQALIATYRTLAGEDPAPRLLRWEIAYAAFRACACAMAAAGAPPDEAARLLADRRRYRKRLRAALERETAAARPL